MRSSGVLALRQGYRASEGDESREGVLPFPAGVLSQQGAREAVAPRPPPVRPVVGFGMGGAATGGGHDCLGALQPPTSLRQLTQVLGEVARQHPQHYAMSLAENRRCARYVASGLQSFPGEQALSAVDVTNLLVRAARLRLVFSQSEPHVVRQWFLGVIRGGGSAEKPNALELANLLNGLARLNIFFKQDEVAAVKRWFLSAIGPQGNARQPLAIGIANAINGAGNLRLRFDQAEAAVVEAWLVSAIKKDSSAWSANSLDIANTFNGLALMQTDLSEQGRSALKEWLLANITPGGAAMWRNEIVVRKLFAALDRLHFGFDERECMRLQGWAGDIARPSLAVHKEMQNDGAGRLLADIEADSPVFELKADDPSERWQWNPYAIGEPGTREHSFKTVPVV